MELFRRPFFKTILIISWSILFLETALLLTGETLRNYISLVGMVITFAGTIGLNFMVWLARR